MTKQVQVANQYLLRLITDAGLWTGGTQQLSAPANLVQTPEDGYVTFSWDAVQGATSYLYQVNDGVLQVLGDVQTIDVYGPNGVEILVKVYARANGLLSAASTEVGGTPTASPSTGFTESFETVVASGTPGDGWYDSGAGNHQIAPMPGGATGNAYVHPFEIGDSQQEIGGTPANQTIRRLLDAPSDIIDIQFKACTDVGFLPNNGDHMMYVRYNSDSTPFRPPSEAGCCYLDAVANGKLHFNFHNTAGAFVNEIFASTGNDFHSGIPRNIRWYMEMNDLGSSNGILRVWVDGLLVIEDLTREYRLNAGEQFEQLIVAPYAAATQTSAAGFYIDELTVSTDAYSPSVSAIALDHSVFSGAGYNAGRLDFVACRSELTALGTHQFLVGRFFGTAGAVSCRVQSYGDTHSNIDVTLNWADGEADYKLIEVPVAAKDPGDHRIWVELQEPTGSVTLHNDVYTIAYGIIDDGTIADDSVAVFFNQLQASNFTGPTSYSGTGTRLNPFNSYYQARDYADANKGTIRYIYGEGVIVPDGVDTDLPFSTGVSLHMPEARTKTTRLVIRNKPGSTLTVEGLGGASGNKFGFISSNTDESYLTFRGIKVQNLQMVASGPCGAFWWHYGTCTENTVERCIIDDIDGSSGANNAGISMWGVVSGKIWDNRISNIQTSGDSTNGNTAAFYSYLGNHLQVQYNSFASTMAGGIFHKRTIANNVSCASKFNDFNNCKLTYAISGGGDPGHDKILAIHNLLRGPKAQFWHSSDIAVLPNAENVIANNFFDTVGISDASAIHNYHMQGARVYNNIFRNCRYAVDWPNAIDSDELKYFDYNQHFGTVVAYVAIQSSGVSKASYQALHGSAATHPIGVNDVTTDPLPINIAAGSAAVGPTSDSLDSGIGGGIIGVFVDDISDVGEMAPSSGISLADAIARTHTEFNGATYGPGRIAIINDYSELTTVGEHIFLIGREYGTEGTVGITYTSGGDPHDTVTGTLTWVDGDASFQAIKVNVPTKGNGEHRIYLELSNATGGAAIHHPGYPVAYGVIDDNTTWHSDSISRFFDTTLGSSGTGTEADPYNNIYECITDADGDPDIKFIYGEGSVVPDGTNTTAPYGKAGVFSIHAPANRADEEHRITIRNKPGSALEINGNGGTNTFGFFNSGSASYCTYKGMSFLNLNATGAPSGGVPGSGIWYHYGTYKGITTEHCVFDNINGSENNGGVNYYGTLGSKVYNSHFNNIQKDGDNTNGNTAGVYSYKGENISVQNCEFESTMHNGIYLKGTELGEVSLCVRFCKFNDTYITFGQQGGGDPGHFGMNVSFSVFDGVKAYVYHRALALQVGVGQNIIYNNSFNGAADGVRGAIEMAFLEDVRIFNNIFDSCKFIFSDQSSEATDIPQFLDHNVVFNLTSGYSAINFVTRDKAATNTLLGTSYGANDSGVDPNPINPAGGNFKPTTPITAGLGGDVCGPWLQDSFNIGLAA